MQAQFNVVIRLFLTKYMVLLNVTIVPVELYGNLPFFFFFRGELYERKTNGRMNNHTQNISSRTMKRIDLDENRTHDKQCKVTRQLLPLPDTYRYENEKFQDNTKSISVLYEKREQINVCNVIIRPFF